MALEVNIQAYYDLVNWDDYTKHDELYDEMKAISDTVLDREDGSLVGALYSEPFADGRAYYVVVKDKPLTVAQVPIWDSWHLHPALIRGLNADDIIGELTWVRNIEEGFKRQKGEA